MQNLAKIKQVIIFNILPYFHSLPLVTSSNLHSPKSWIRQWASCMLYMYINLHVVRATATQLIWSFLCMHDFMYNSLHKWITFYYPSLAICCNVCMLMMHFSIISSEFLALFWICRFLILAFLIVKRKKKTCIVRWKYY